MESFELWQSKMQELTDQGEKGTVLFLAYKPISESDARAAGFELVGATWDASGNPAKAYKPATAKVPAYVCVICNRTSRLDQGMYCCGKKRVLSS
jgi:hypothetical protein